MNILEKIKDAEQEAAKIKSEATAKARAIARDGELACASEAKKIVEKANAEAEALCEKAKITAQDKANAFIEDEKQKDKKSTDEAAAKLTSAVEYIVKEVQTL